MGISGFGYLIKEGLKNVWNNRLMSIASICVLVSCLVLTGSAVLFSMNVSQVVETVGSSNETTVYIKEGYSRVEAVYIGREIAKLDNVESTEYVSKDDALEQFKDELGEEIFADFEDDNPLPDSFVVVMTDLSKYNDTVKQIKKIDGVEKVDSHAATAKKLASINDMVQILSLAIVIALTVISLFIISNTIRATMYSRRFEISIMKSVGATNTFVRIPFVVEGMTIGLIASIISTGAMYFVYKGVMQIIAYSMPFFTAIPISEVIMYVAGAFVISGVLIGALSGFVSIRKYLKKEGNEILGW